MKNSEVIDGPNYYKLPCGKYLEDFIWAKGMCFAWGSALKYYFRAGKKDGESKVKDLKKCAHYCKYIATEADRETGGVFLEIEKLCEEANSWDGVVKHKTF